MNASEQPPQPDTDPLEGEVIPKEVEEVAKDVPKKVVANIVRVTRRIESETRWIGPLPPPEIFKQYPPDVRKAMVQQASAQMKHRQKIENKVIESNIKNSGRGMNYAFGLTITLIVVGAFLVAIGKSTEGLIAIFGTSGFQAGNYLLQKWREMHKVSSDVDKQSDKHAKGEVDEQEAV
jgi:uncharacterized membrane protein